MNRHLVSVVRRVLKVALYLSDPVSIQKIVLPGGSFGASFGSNRLGNLTCWQFHLNYHFRALRVVSVLPFAESITEGDIVWKKAVGDHVNPDGVVAEIETDRTNVPVHTHSAGVIKEILVDDGGKVVTGQEILKIEEGAVAAAAAPSASMTPASSPPPSLSPSRASVTETAVGDKKRNRQRLCNPRYEGTHTDLAYTSSTLY
ncbi:hypothetical protein CRM22_006906 [Opisthorchis felineus]|uniref:Lipoyl-binding domain-containing protein n=1 Tax=Opisthorchis felineus TaxID=147828 RepID=A0A4S2LQB7_OPIFE|nr:hypothetical protein CRM22_006906 [Opisthorchis felineus]